MGQIPDAKFPSGLRQAAIIGHPPAVRITKLFWCALVIPLLLLACGGDDDDGEAVPTPAPGEDAVVVLDEWSVEPSPGSVASGDITLGVINEGAQAHELTIYATDLPLDGLPLADWLVDESILDPLASTPVIVGGQSRQLTVSLEPGRYVLVCNLPAHYERGMRAEFIIE